MLYLLHDHKSGLCHQYELPPIDTKVKNMKELHIYTFSPDCDNGIRALYFCLLDHNVEHIPEMGNMAMHYASTYETVSCSIEKVCRSTSKRTAKLMDETVNNMVPTLREMIQKSESQQSIKCDQPLTLTKLQFHVYRYGLSLTLKQFSLF